MVQVNVDACNVEESVIL